LSTLRAKALTEALSRARVLDDTKEEADAPTWSTDDESAAKGAVDQLIEELIVENKQLREQLEQTEGKLRKVEGQLNKTK
jgi:hypothetical protein